MPKEMKNVQLLSKYTEYNVVLQKNKKDLLTPGISLKKIKYLKDHIEYLEKKVRRYGRKLKLND